MGSGTLYSVQLLGVGFSLFIIISVFLMVKARLMREKYSLIWFGIGLFTLIMSLFTDLMDWFSNIAGVDYAPSLFFAVLLVCAYFLLLNMSVSLSGLKLQNKALTQELGLLKLRLEALEKERDGGERQSNI